MRFAQLLTTYLVMLTARAALHACPKFFVQVCLCRFEMWLCCWGALLWPLGAWLLLCAYASFTRGCGVGVFFWSLLVPFCCCVPTQVSHVSVLLLCCGLLVPACCCVPMQVSHVAVLLGCCAGACWWLSAAACLRRCPMWLWRWGVVQGMPKQVPNIQLTFSRVLSCVVRGVRMQVSHVSVLGVYFAASPFAAAETKETRL